MYIQLKEKEEQCDRLEGEIMLARIEADRKKIKY